mmetsp:Transcript_12730/g.18579  ORF Transcript_12730/g.18579 Transcript_12730/m.18579 type:complete len:210 (-) Transcript_12730:552-1181(-)
MKAKASGSRSSSASFSSDLMLSFITCTADPNLFWYQASNSLTSLVLSWSMFWVMSLVSSFKAFIFSKRSLYVFLRSFICLISEYSSSSITSTSSSVLLLRIWSTCCLDSSIWRLISFTVETSSFREAFLSFKSFLLVLRLWSSSLPKEFRNSMKAWFLSIAGVGVFLGRLSWGEYLSGTSSSWRKPVRGSIAEASIGLALAGASPKPNP